MIRRAASRAPLRSVKKRKFSVDPSIAHEFTNVELSVHFDGSINLETLFQIADRRELLPPGVKTKNDLRKHVTLVEQRVGSIDIYLKIFQRICALIAGDKEGLEQIAYELVKRQYDNRVEYTEVKYVPHLLTGGLKIEEVVETINRGLKRGMAEFGVTTQVILCCLRDMPIWSWQILDLCKAYQAAGDVPMEHNGLVVGIGLVGSDEINHPNKLHTPIFQNARKLGIPRTVVAGESGGEHSVASAFDLLYTNRISGGYRATERKATWIRCVKPFVHLEVCPTHSIRVACNTWDGKWASHPLMKYRKDEANYSFCSMSPSVLGINIQSEIRLAQERLHFTDEMICTSVLNAARSSFLEVNEKNDLLARMRQRWALKQRHLTGEFSGVEDTGKQPDLIRAYWKMDPQPYKFKPPRTRERDYIA